MRIPKNPDETRMTIGEHLEELRRRLLRALLGFFVAGVACYVFRDAILEVLLRPHRMAAAALREDGAVRLDENLRVLAYTETFVVYLKVSAVGALFLSAPFVLYQIWAFIAAGLYENERRVFRRFFPAALGLFGAGVALGYFGVLPVGLTFLARMVNPELLTPDFRLLDYVSFFLWLTFSFGLVFETPLVMLALARVGVFTPASYAKGRRWFVLIAFILAAFLTPGPDPFSQILMALPMIALYEVGIWLSRAAPRRRGAEQTLPETGSA